MPAGCASTATRLALSAAHRDNSDRAAGRDLQLFLITKRGVVAKRASLDGQRFNTAGASAKIAYLESLNPGSRWITVRNPA